jgi:ABC-type multidrug transport system fused ATPase/permease subunit
MDATSSRQAALERQIERVQKRQERLFARRNRYVRRQLTIVVVGFFIAFSAMAISRWLGLFVIVAGVIAVVLMAISERRVSPRIPLYDSLARMLETQIARLRLDWHALPEVPATEEGTDHPFDTDLDITGERSLHRLLNTAVSVGGTERLRQWLLSRSPNLDVIRQRQALVRELVPQTRFRNQFLLHSLFAARLGSESMEAEGLLEWLEAQNASGVRQRLSTLVIASVLSAAIYVSVILALYFAVSPFVCVGAAVLAFGWFLLTSKEQGDLAGDTFYTRLVLGQLQDIFTFLEKYRYPRNGQLRALCSPFFEHGDHNPSFLLKKLKKITQRATFARQAESWTVLNAFVPVGAYTAYQLDGCKKQILEHLPVWLETWYELEALCSLANFAYLNPDYVMPELAVSDKGKEARQEAAATFRARDLGHPLLAREKKVTNTLSIDKLGTIIMITGSNMAGKSTFLRTIGVNLCLAYAGTVVNASSLQTSLFELYACIRVTDSLADGYSYFYAEVRRLKGLLERLRKKRPFPQFFLIDEIFRGTNNYERLIGSEAYIHALAGERCVGAISTHDLELVKLADTLPDIVNMHFREDVIKGKMVFDYRLRSGPCPTRNALKIMELEGLPVRWDVQSGTKK